MRSFIKRHPVALSMALLWTGWAVWANVPHYYDAQAIEKEIAAVLGQANVNLQPAEAGFPFAYMRYDYSNSNQLTIHDTELSALLPNLLVSLAGTLGVALLVARMHRISLSGYVALCCLVAPAAFMYIRLNGLHPAIISYLYLLPVILVMIIVATEAVQGRGEKIDATHSSRETGVVEN